MRSALLYAYSAEELFIILRLLRSAERNKRIFTSGVVTGDGRRGLGRRYSFRLKCKVWGFARGSPFGRAGKAVRL